MVWILLTTAGVDMGGNIELVKWALQTGGISVVILFALGWVIYRWGFPMVEARLKRQDAVIDAYQRALADQHIMTVEAVKAQSTIAIEVMKEQLQLSNTQNASNTAAFLASLASRDSVQSAMHEELVKINMHLQASAGPATRPATSTRNKS